MATLTDLPDGLTGALPDATTRIGWVMRTEPDGAARVVFLEASEELTAALVILSAPAGALSGPRH